MIFELEGVTKYYGRFKALDDLAVAVRPGAIGLLGPNGAGKSTLIKLLLGLVRLSAGRAAVLGLDVRRDSRRIRERVGYMPEDDCSIAGMKGIESVALTGELGGLPRFAALRRAHEILDYVTLGEARYREVQTYSVGMRQKIKLAQALIHSPELVFLDEPTSGLDPVGRERMLELIRNLARKKGVSVVVSTHILSDVEASCDAALILGRGRLLVYDELEALRDAVEPGLRVRVSGGAPALAQELIERGLACEVQSEDELRIPTQGATVAAQLFEAAKRSGVIVRQIEPSHNSLEKTFLEAVRETSRGPRTGSEAS